MKITKYVEMDVEVDVSLEDITMAIKTSTDTLSDVLAGVNNCHRFFKAVPDAIIDSMNEHQRKIIYDAMLIQVNRYAAKLGGGES